MISVSCEGMANMVTNLIILGSGGYGRTVCDIGEQLEYHILAALDDANPCNPLESFAKYISPSAYFIPAFGNNEFRLQWCEQIEQAGGQLATLIHPTAYISPKANIEPGTVILPKAVINTGTTVGKGCIINIGALVDHDCIIEDGVHICLGAIVKGENRIKVCTKIEAGEIVERGQYPL